MLDEDAIFSGVLHGVESGVVGSDLVGCEATIFLANALARLRTNDVGILVDVHVL